MGRPDFRRGVVRRTWRKPWKYEYCWVNSAYGCVLGYAWTRREAERRLDRAAIDLISEDW